MIIDRGSASRSSKAGRFWRPRIAETRPALQAGRVGCRNSGGQGRSSGEVEGRAGDSKNVFLNAANDVDLFAAAATIGPVVFTDVDGYTTGTVPGGVLITNDVTGMTP